MADFAWTAERVTALRVMVAAGDTASQIGAHFSITRSAVIGKAHREHIPWPNPPHRPHGRPKAIGPAKRARMRKAFGPLRLVEPEPSIGKPVPLADLTMAQCHFPVDGGYCGQPVVDHTSWCEWHYRMTHQTQKKAAPFGAA